MLSNARANESNSTRVYRKPTNMTDIWLLSLATPGYTYIGELLSNLFPTVPESIPSPSDERSKAM